MRVGKREEFNNIYFQSLKGHSLDSLKILEKYIELNYDVIQEFCSYWDIDFNLFIKNLYTYIYFHDLGKLTKEFQNNIFNGKHSQRYPHAYYSFFILRNLNSGFLLKDIPIELLAILSHHSQLYSGIYSNHQNISKPTFYKEDISFFINDFFSVYNEFTDEEFTDEELNDLVFKNVSIYKTIIKLIRKTNKFKNKFLLKSVFTYFFSILQLCDDFSSANFHYFIKKYDGDEKNFDNVLINPEIYVLDIKDKNYVDDFIFKDIQPYFFQHELLSIVSKFSLLFAPCGRGKTEASLSWALKALKKYNKNKIIFAMPTQVTSNAMWERLCKIFGRENVGLFHGKTFIKLKNLETSDSLDEVSSEVFKGNVFFKPITVTTIDHVIYSFVHGFSQSDFALGNLQTSVMIFDEVHYYEENTLNHLYTLFGFLKEMNIPHILMSGTLPNFITDKLPDYNMIIDEEGLNLESFSIEYYDECLVRTDNFDFNEILLNEIKLNDINGLKQFFIFNTVKRAQTFYFKLKSILPNTKIILYHSQFTHNHRVQKEIEILDHASKDEGFILIATQVIEISLDISADVMYTELAPPDALGQRGGRLNRKRKEGSFKMKLFDSESHLPYDEELINKTKEFLKVGPISYQTFKIWCDEVYDNRELNKTNLINFFNDSVLFGNRPIDVAFSEDKGNKLEIRKETLPKVDVIPLDVYHNEKDNLNVKNQVKIPLWWINKDEDETSEDCRSFYNESKDLGKKQRSFIICSFDYSYEYGFNTDEQSKFNEEDNCF